MEVDNPQPPTQQGLCRGNLFVYHEQPERPQVEWGAVSQAVADPILTQMCTISVSTGSVQVSLKIKTRTLPVIVDRRQHVTQGSRAHPKVRSPPLLAKS